MPHPNFRSLRKHPPRILALADREAKKQAQLRESIPASHFTPLISPILADQLPLDSSTQKALRRWFDQAQASMTRKDGQGPW